MDLLLHRPGSNVVYYAIVLAARVPATCWAIRRHRPPAQRPWRLLAVAAAAWTVGDLAQAVGVVNRTHGDAVNLSDACFLIGFAAAFVAFVLLGRGPNGRGPISGALDATIGFVAFAVPAWAFLVTPTTLDVASHGLPATLRMMYPVLGMLLAAMLFWMGAAPEVRTASYRVLLLALMLRAGSDAGYHLDSFSSGASDALVQATWLLSSVLWGAAMLMPSLSGFWRRRDRSIGEYTTGRLALVLIATMSAPITLVLQFWMGTEIDILATTVGGVLMFALWTVRFRRLVGRLCDQSERLDELAQLDVLTGLPNRRALNARLQSVLDRRDRDGVSVLVIDLDRFKGYNDAFGHRVGDELLVAVSRRWRDRLGPDVYLARTGGDEFTAIVVAPGDDAGHAAASVIVEALDDPVVVSHLVLAVDVSVGVSTGRSTDPSATAETLLHRADLAMYAAKARQTRIVVHDDGLDDRADDAFILLNELRGGLARGELTMHFQPQLDLATGTVSGAEALVRWFHPTRGPIAPCEFLPAAENTGLIRDVTSFALRSSLAACSEWRTAGLDLRVGVNVSALSLVDPGFVDEVSSELERHGLPPSALDIEITESVAIVDIGGSSGVLDELARRGVRLSIDDFGTGHSSLGYLQRLPMGVIKIDQSFVRTMASNPGDETIVRSTIGLAKSFGMETVAEGVEDLLMLDMLRSLGCDIAQGHAIARPVAAGDIVEVVGRIESIHRVRGATPTDMSRAVGR